MCDSSPKPRKTVYLDMNIWVELARRATPEWKHAREALEDATTRGALVLPLSAAHYLELWHRLDARSREDVGTVMRDLSGYQTLKPVDAVRSLELAAHIDRSRGLPVEMPSSFDVLGVGANYAFNSRYGRFRFVESLATSDSPEGPPAAAPDNLDDEALTGPGWEWLQLMGTQEILEKDGIERTPQHRRGSQVAEVELQMRTDLATDEAMRARMWDLIVTQEIAGMTDEINDLCQGRDWDPHLLFLRNTGPGGPRAAMTRFVRALPTLNVYCTLRYLKHRDATHPWEQHDLTDLIALATAIPYCDAVVTERRWVHLARAGGLAKTYNTEMGRGAAGVIATTRSCE